MPDRQAAGVIFFGGNISSDSQIAAVITQFRQAQAMSPIQEPLLLLMTDQEGGLVRRRPGEPVLSESRSASPLTRSRRQPRPGTERDRTWPAWG